MGNVVPNSFTGEIKALHRFLIPLSELASQYIIFDTISHNITILVALQDLKKPQRVRIHFFVEDHLTRQMVHYSSKHYYIREPKIMINKQ
jgi:hypothetical protein